LDFDGFSHASAMEQNFNPSKLDIERRQNLGYPRLLSGEMTNFKTTLPFKQSVYYPESLAEAPWTFTNRQKRYYMSMPFYPFRTLCPRDVAMYPKMTSSEFDSSSPIFPGNTQLNIVLTRRKNNNFLDYMIPLNLAPTLGTTQNQLTAEQRTTATSFTVTNADRQQVQHSITRVEIVLNNLYLQVIRLKYKGISPERPLSNVFTSYRTIFTPLQKVSLHTYELSWETAAFPTAVYIGFVKESDIQYVDTNRVFHTPGIYYRPNQLKSMTCLLGNTDSRTVFNNFELENLNTNNMDYSHLLYEKYLQNNYFIPPGERNYFEHNKNNIIPAHPPSTDLEKGLFNVFPISLQSDVIQSKKSSSTLGVVTSSPLRLELRFEPVLDITWFMFYTFVYMNKINFTGSKTKQDVTYDYLK
jgi:hypothetical protein